MLLIKVAGTSGPSRIGDAGWRRDVVVGHRMTGGPLVVHSPNQTCSWCDIMPAAEPLTDAIVGDHPRP